MLLTTEEIIRRVCEPSEFSEQLSGWCTVDKARRLVAIASRLPQPASCVEVGVHGGRSLVALAAGLRAAGYGQIIGVDSYAAADCLEGDQSDVDKQLWSTTDYEALYREAVSAIERRDYGISTYASVMRERSEAFSRCVVDASLNLIHLDGNHSELVSCRDVAMWLPKMRSQSVWICDDTNWPSMQKALGMLEAAGFKRTEIGSEGYWSVYER